MVGCAGGDAVETCKTERRASGCLGGRVEGWEARRLPRRVRGAIRDGGMYQGILWRTAAWHVGPGLSRHTSLLCESLGQFSV